jgi:hypothetical protein
MGLSWQQGPLSPGAIGRFLVPEALPKRLLYSEPLRRRISVTHIWRHGRIVTPTLRSAASPIWCRSSRISSRYSSTAPSSVSSRVRA